MSINQQKNPTLQKNLTAKAPKPMSSTTSKSSCLNHGPVLDPGSKTVVTIRQKGPYLENRQLVFPASRRQPESGASLHLPEELENGDALRQQGFQRLSPYLISTAGRHASDQVCRFSMLLKELYRCFECGELFCTEGLQRVSVCQAWG